MPRRSLAAVAVVAAALALVTGCGRTVNRTAERKVREALPGYIGPAREWRVHVDNPWERTLRGRMRRITIDGDDVELRQTITCRSLRIVLDDVDYDIGRSQLKAVGQATFEAVISEKGLNDYLRAAPPPPSEPVRIRRVRLRSGVLHAEGTRRLLGRDWPFTVQTRPRLATPTRLVYDPQRMSVVGLRVPLPGSVLQWLARRLDSGFDFGTLPFPVRIGTFRVQSGEVRLQGTADVMQSLNQELPKHTRSLPGPGREARSPAGNQE